MAETKKETKYLFGNFVGKKGSLIINADSKKSNVEAFLKSNPELKEMITNEDSISEQRKLIK